MLVLLVLLLPVTYVAGRCPAGAIQGLQPDHCYVRRTDPAGWFEAEERCRRLGGHLASATSGFQNAFLADVWDGLLPHYYFWLGGSRNVTSSSGNWDWTDGSTFSYTNWEKCRPTADVGLERCLLMLPANGQWHSSDCSDEKNYICAVPPVTQEVDLPKPPPQGCHSCCPSGWTLFGVTGRCYKLLYDLRWNDALAACQAMNASLASIHSDEENNWLADFAATNLDIWSRVWFGLNDLRLEGAFEFTDGTKMDYTNWAPAMPQRASGADCVFFHVDAPVDGEDRYLKWANYPCELHGPQSIYAAICQLTL